MGGHAETIEAHLKENYPENFPAALPDFSDALDLAMAALRAAGERELTAENVESAVLDRTRGRRKFRRVTEEELHSQF